MGDTTSLPQQTGAPHTIILVQMMLYTSLVTSVFSAFLAVLCKQLLNRYALTDIRRNAIECSRDRQRELDGMVTWEFYQATKSLPVMLEFAFLLLGCALSRYSWGIDVIAAWVVLGVTMFGVIGFRHRCGDQYSTDRYLHRLMFAVQSEDIDK